MLTVMFVHNVLCCCLMVYAVFQDGMFRPQ